MKKNRSLNTTLNVDEKEETECDEGDESEFNDTANFNIVVDMKDNSMHGDANCVDDNESMMNYKTSIIPCTRILRGESLLFLRNYEYSNYMLLKDLKL